VGDTLSWKGAPIVPNSKTAVICVSTQPAAEYGEAARPYAGYFGTWSVNEADKTLTQRLEGALIPNAEGTEQKSSVGLAGDEWWLTLNQAAGGRIDFVYRRAK
jgi:hypothetical protein